MEELKHPPQPGLAPQNDSLLRAAASFELRKGDKLPEAPQSVLSGPVDRVGMQGLELPLFLSLPHADTCVPAQIDAQLSLDDPHARGLHLSRVYNLLVQQLRSSIFLKRSYRLHIEKLKILLKECVHSQKGLSQNAFLNIDFILPVPRQSLTSQRPGWRQYSVRLEASVHLRPPRQHDHIQDNTTQSFKQTVQHDFQIALGGRVLYSSTCPCSMALSQQAWQEQLGHDFKQQDRAAEPIKVEDVKAWMSNSYVATPHAQRSRVDFKLQLADACLVPESVAAPQQAADLELPPHGCPSYVQVIDSIEQALGTPVQGAVSRGDEKQFARLNAQNPMFCEDAARRLKHCFNQNKNFKAFDFYIQHQESLHPHNVVSRVSSSSE